MKLEDQVVSLELAKRLKELGVTQKSAFYWATSEVKCGTVSGELDLELSNYASGDYDNCSAFTVAELGEIIPPYFHTHRLKDGSWRGATDQDIAENEAEARAKMLIHLIEKGIVRP